MSTNDHKNSRNEVLKVYLDRLNDIVTGQCRKDPIQFVRTVHAIFSSVQDVSLFYDGNEFSWMFDYETKEVCILLSVYILWHVCKYR